MRSLFRKKSIGQILKDEIANPDLVDDIHNPGLARNLRLRDLVGFGIAAIVGAGIFSTIGTASYEGGPGVVLLFIFTAIACSFAAFCYAEFASMVPISGSAYTYSYVSFGELFAWIIGWALIMEYSVGNITVAISWSDYFTGLLGSMNIHLPQWMTMDYLSARNSAAIAENLFHSGLSIEQLSDSVREGYLAWTGAPLIGNFHLVLDLPALLIIFLITYLVFIGIRETRNASNLMVAVKVTVVIGVIIVGAFFVDTSHWNPFLPNGISGVLKGVSAVFFAYIGFDAISTTAEECKDPQRDLPRGMMYSIIICTILYIGISLVLTGMVPFHELAVGDPLAFVFQRVGMNWISGIVAVSAIFAMASVLLVFQLGQPRIWMAMSRDGLLPSKFSKIHKKYKTPGFATIMTGMLVAIPALFFNLTFVTDLCSIGTLFAFVLVCGGVLILQNKKDVPRGKFRTPYVNARWIMPAVLVIAVVLFSTVFKDAAIDFIANKPQAIDPVHVFHSLDKTQIDDLRQMAVTDESARWQDAHGDMEVFIRSLSPQQINQYFHQIRLTDNDLYESGFDVFKHKIPMWIFIVVFLTMVWLSFKHNLSLIPVMGVLTCLYMMTQIELKNWIGFGIWLVVGLVIYFLYGYRKSKLNVKNT
jgi:amino acid transporter